MGLLFEASPLAVSRPLRWLLIILLGKFGLSRSALTRILHCLAGLSSVFNKFFARSKSLIYSASFSSSFPASVIYHKASQLAHTFVGFNNLFGSCYTKVYFPEDRLCADIIRGYRLMFGHTSPYEEVICIIACS